MKEIKMFVIKALIACAMLFVIIFAGILIYTKVPYKTLTLTGNSYVYIDGFEEDYYAYSIDSRINPITLKYYNNGLVKIIQDGKEFYASVNTIVITPDYMR